MDDHDAATLCAMSGHVPMTWAHVLLVFCRLTFIRSSLRGHVSLHDSHTKQLNRDHRISLKRSTVMNIAGALMAIWWTEIHHINARWLARIDPTHHALPRRLWKLKNLVPLTRRNREVVNFTQSRVKNNSKLTNLMKIIRIEGYNGK